MARTYCCCYKGVEITKVRRFDMDFYEFVLNHAPYSVPYIEDCYQLIDMQ